MALSLLGTCTVFPNDVFVRDLETGYRYHNETWLSDNGVSSVFSSLVDRRTLGMMDVISSHDDVRPHFPKILQSKRWPVGLQPLGIATSRIVGVLSYGLLTMLG